MSNRTLLALMSNRTLVYPDIPCTTKWVHTFNDSPKACTNYSLLLGIESDLMPYAARVDPADPNNLDKEFRIFSSYIADQHCTGPNRVKLTGMLNVELKTDAPAGATLPAVATNTLMGMDYKPVDPFTDEFLQFNEYEPVTLTNTLMGVDYKHADIFTDEFLQFSEYEVAGELSKYDDQAVLYIGRPMVVEMEDFVESTSKGWQKNFWDTMQKCRALFAFPRQMGLDRIANGQAQLVDFLKGPVASIKDGKVLYDGGLQAIESVMANMSCNHVELCSLKRTKKFFGAHGDSSTFRSALMNASYKGELVVVTVESKEDVYLFLQLANRFKKWGYDHIMALASREFLCQSIGLAVVNRGPFSCTWLEPPSWASNITSQPLVLRQLQLSFFTRAARLGYNLMALDAKSPPPQYPRAGRKPKSQKTPRPKINNPKGDNGTPQDHTQRPRTTKIEELPQPNAKTPNITPKEPAKTADAAKQNNTKRQDHHNLKADGAVTYLLNLASEGLLRVLDETPGALEAVIKPLLSQGGLCGRPDLLLLNDAMAVFTRSSAAGLLKSCVQGSVQGPSQMIAASGSVQAASQMMCEYAQVCFVCLWVETEPVEEKSSRAQYKALAK
eukprot:gene24898-10563_t